jgi:hypothetical protein
VLQYKPWDSCFSVLGILFVRVWQHLDAIWKTPNYTGQKNTRAYINAPRKIRPFSPNVRKIQNSTHPSSTVPSLRSWFRCTVCVILSCLLGSRTSSALFSDRHAQSHFKSINHPSIQSVVHWDVTLEFPNYLIFAMGMMDCSAYSGSWSFPQPIPGFVCCADLLWFYVLPLQNTRIIP